MSNQLGKQNLKSDKSVYVCYDLSCWKCKGGGEGEGGGVGHGQNAVFGF